FFICFFYFLFFLSCNAFSIPYTSPTRRSTDLGYEPPPPAARHWRSKPASGPRKKPATTNAAAVWSAEPQPYQKPAPGSSRRGRFGRFVPKTRAYPCVDL